MATLVTRSGKGSPLTHAEVDANFTNLNTDKLELSGGTMTGNLSFGDNDKAIFGAGSDLEIYHDGADSYVHDAGTGILRLKSNGTKILMETAAGETLAEFINNGNAVLYSNNVERVRTNGTGIDVTGSISADGLTVNSGAANTVALFQSTDSVASIYLVDSNTTGGASASHGLITTGDNLAVRAVDNVIIETGTTDRLRVDTNGDISFYEDTGTTAKFFWDASAESLGIGTTTVNYPLDVRKSSTTDYVSSSTSQATPYVNGDSVISLTNATSTTNRGAFLSLGSTDAWGVTNIKYLGVVSQTGSYGGNFVIGGRTASTAYSEHFRIDPTGNVGIGATSPASKLQVDDANNVRFSFTESGTGHAYLTVRAGYNTKDSQITFSNNTNSTTGSINYDHTSNFMKFSTNGNNERMRIDSSGRVMIGTTSSSSLFTVQSTGTSTAHIKTTATNGFAQMRFENDAKAYSIGVGSNDQLYFYDNTSSTNRILIDSSGNVGIGTSSPASLLHLDQGSGGNGLRFERDSYDTMDIELSESGLRIRNETDGRTDLLIDGSGNLLVGTTSTEPRNFASGTYGIRLFSSQPEFGVGTMYINRSTGTDGAIISFRKDGGTVGNIGSAGGGVRPYFAGNNVGLSPYNGVVYPTNGSGTAVNNSVDLGASGYAFQDLYLSGGVYLGGTGSANKLEDYEEGTWTPSVEGSTSDGSYTYSEQQGVYTKIGQQVIASFNLTNVTTVTAGSGDLEITGLPFNINYPTGFNINAHGNVTVSYFGNAERPIFPVLQDGTAKFKVYLMNTSSSNDVMAITDKTSNGSDIRGFVIYQTNS